MHKTKEKFDLWNGEKKRIHCVERKVFFKERDIFFMYMGHNVRFEQNGKGSEFTRPVVIIKKFNNDLFWGVALTSLVKEGKYYFPFSMQGVMQYAILSQLRLYDRNRLVRKIGMITKSDFLFLKQKIKSLL